MQINADIGECGFEVDSQVISLINMASIACGGHIGDEISVQQTIKLAKNSKVQIGAHISYKDKINFGRISPDINLIELRNDLESQLKLIQKIAIQENYPLNYIKPHGALYHDFQQNQEIFYLIISLLKEYLLDGFLVVQKNILNSQMLKYAQMQKVNLMFEVFADRGYNGDKLISRGEKNAVLSDEKKIIKHFHGFEDFKNTTICFHSDNPASIKALLLLKNENSYSR